MAGTASPPFPREALDAVYEPELGEQSLYLAWELTRCCQGLSADEERSIVLCLLASIEANRRGNTRLDLEALPDYFRLFAPADGLLDVALDVLSGIGKQGETFRGHEIFGRAGDYKPLLLETEGGGSFLYHQRMLMRERRLGADLASRILAKPDTSHYQAILDALDDVLEHPTKQGGKLVRLTAEQQHAVRTALGHPLTMISGGPGTGKTSIVVSIVRLLSRLSFDLEDIALAAPTGKAAHRMGEAIRKGLTAIPGRPDVDSELLRRMPEAVTIHRLLGYSGRTSRFWYGRSNRLTAKIVIVDEASMIDLELMDRLVGALSADTKLVLLGDANQLPAVGAGAVFQSLSVPGADVETDPRAKVGIVLNKSYRMDAGDSRGRRILSVANFIHRGQGSALFDNDERNPAIEVRQSPGELKLEGVELLDDGQDSKNRQMFFERWFDARVGSHPHFAELIGHTYSYDRRGFSSRDSKALSVLLAHLESHKILTVTRRDASVANRTMHDILALRFPSQRCARVGGEVFVPGEPVMVLHNDYERDLFNGDQGVVVDVSIEGGRSHPRCVFRRGDRFESFDPEALSPHLTRAFAVTIHKSQGSELEGVTIVLPEEDMPLLTREMLYTALTRSSAQVALLGSRKLLLNAVSRPTERSTGLPARIRDQVSLAGDSSPPERA